jgi:hypothetical protein
VILAYSAAGYAPGKTDSPRNLAHKFMKLSLRFHIAAAIFASNTLKKKGS